MKTLLRILDAVVKMVKLNIRKIIAWEPLYRVTRRRASRKTLVEYSMQKGAIELDGSGFKVLKLERPEGLSRNGFRIYIDDILICNVDSTSGKVGFTENSVKNYYELVNRVRKILRNVSKGGLRIKDAFETYFEENESNDPRYDRSFESNVETRMTAVGWQIF